MCIEDTYGDGYRDEVERTYSLGEYDRADHACASIPHLGGRDEVIRHFLFFIFDIDEMR